MPTQDTPPSPESQGPPQPGLEARLDVMAKALQALEARVVQLEGQVPGAVQPSSELRATQAAPPSPLGLPEPSASPGEAGLGFGTAIRVIGLIGQVCLVLGGAYLIRALTDSGTLPHLPGVAVGIAYAVTWGIVAYRLKRVLDASFFAVTSAMIAFPLLFESTTAFKILSPGVAAAILVGITCFLMTVAWRRSLEAVAWLVTLASLGTGFVLMAATQSLQLFGTVFLAFGAASLWVTYGRRWHGLRWPVALAADGAVLVLTLIAAWPGGRPEAYRNLSTPLVMTLALGLVVVYLGSFTVRVLKRHRAPTGFEIVQTALVLLIGFGGAVRVALASETGASLLGAMVLMLGVGCYAAAFPFAEDEDEVRANFVFFSVLGLVFILMGGPIVLPLSAFAILCALFGLVATDLGLRFRRTVLILQGTIYLSVAAAVSGLLSGAYDAFLAPAGHLPSLSVIALLVLGALGAAHGFFVVNRPVEALVWRLRIPSFLLGGEAVLGLGGVMIWGISYLISGANAPPPETLAAIRTVVMSAAAIALAVAERRIPTSEVTWLVYPILAATALKLLMEDLPLGKPLPLFLAFTCYGASLILAPRLMRNRADRPVDQDPDSPAPGDPTGEGKV